MRKIILVAALFGPVPAWAGACPQAVAGAIAKAFPDAKTTSCTQAKEHGKVRYEAKLTRPSGGVIEVDLEADGAIIQTESAIDITDVPATVMDAFRARYPGAAVAAAEKQVKADGGVDYELAWRAKGRKREATFKADGKFVDEE
jgi:O-acetyl-ADP-ribose deacetylase (regulator of RNase III)